MPQIGHNDVGQDYVTEDKLISADAAEELGIINNHRERKKIITILLTLTMKLVSASTIEGR